MNNKKSRTGKNHLLGPVVYIKLYSNIDINKTLNSILSFLSLLFKIFIHVKRRAIYREK